MGRYKVIAIGLGCMYKYPSGQVFWYYNFFKSTNFLYSSICSGLKLLFLLVNSISERKLRKYRKTFLRVRNLIFTTIGIEARSGF